MKFWITVPVPSEFLLVPRAAWNPIPPRKKNIYENSKQRTSIHVLICITLFYFFWPSFVQTNDRY